MPSLREARKQPTRETIVERALELFTEKGCAATTIDEIAAAAGTTRVTFYANYPTRADLTREFMARVNAVLDLADGPDRGSTEAELVDVATLWTRRKFEPNREHALEVLADSWYHLLCDEG